MTAKRILEVCSFNIQSSIIAEKAGAMRVELCDNPVEGGTTPSYGAIRQTRKHISIKLYPIIRPRAGNYLYDELEFNIIADDIQACKEIGCDGISVGVQLADGRIDMERLKKITEWAYPMGVTCNRAFDATPDPFKALEDIIACGCERVLTSGQKTAAPDAGELLGQLIEQADGRIIIMPGAGVDHPTLQNLHGCPAPVEFHSSARKTIANSMTFANPEISDFGNVYMADEDELRAMVDAIK